MYFSSNRFLKNIKESTSSRLRLKHWLVLAARLLFITFLVLAFAQPYFPSKQGEAGASGLVKIYVDNSYSMSNEASEGVTALDEALAYAGTIVKEYPKSTKYTLLTNEYSLSSEQVMSYDRLLDALTEVQLSPVSRNMDEVVSRLKSSSKTFPDQKAKTTL